MCSNFKIFLLLVTLTFVNSLPLNVDQTAVDAGSEDAIVVEAPGSGEEEIDNTGDGSEGTDTGIEDNGNRGLYFLYTHKTDVALLAKILGDAFNLKGGMDKMYSGIDAKTQGYTDIFYRRKFKSGLEKTILGDEMVVRGMRQGGKALFNLAVDNVYAVALHELLDSQKGGQDVFDMD